VQSRWHRRTIQADILDGADHLGFNSTGGVVLCKGRLTNYQGPCKLYVALTAEKAAGEHSVQASKPPTQSVGGVCKVNLQAREDKVKAVKWYVPMHIELCPREHKKSMEDLIEIKKD